MTRIDDSERADELGRFFASLKDRPLEPDDPAYVPGVHLEASGDPINDLARQIAWDQGGGTYLFTGQRGTGKSTELRRLRRDLQAQGCTVFLLDMSSYLLETEPIEIGDFVISLMGALSDEVEKLYQVAPAGRSYWQRAVDFMHTEVAVKEFSAQGLKLELKGNPTFKEKIQAASRNNLSALVRDARNFVLEVCELVQALDGAGRKIVLIADSVERLRGVNADGAKKVFDSAVALFSGNPDNLKFPPLHVVYSVPPYLSALTANLSALYSSQMVFLASAHVFETPAADKSRQPSARGLDALRRMVSQRYANWEAVLSAPQLDRLALATGGDIRDFFRLIAACLVKASNPALGLPVSDQVLTDVENAMRREMLPIPDEDKDWLKEIATTKQAELKTMDRLSTLGRYFDTRLVLNYRNGSDWYDVHPLLWKVIDAHESRPDTGTRPAV